jgi:hypothetical protein
VGTLQVLIPSGYEGDPRISQFSTSNETTLAHCWHSPTKLTRIPSPRLRHLIIQYTDEDLNDENVESALDAVKSRVEARRLGLTPTGEELERVTIYAFDAANDPRIRRLVEEIGKEGVNGVPLKVQVRERRIDFGLGWQSWSQIDEELSRWPGLHKVAGTAQF